MTWRVLLSEKAASQLEPIREPDISRLRKRILALAEHPHPPGAIPVQGTAFLRLRVGDWRVLYQAYPAERLVRVAYVLRRNEGTYSRLA